MTHDVYGVPWAIGSREERREAVDAAMQTAVPCASHSLARELGSPGLQGCICLHLRCGHIIISSCRDTEVEMGMAAYKRWRNNNIPGMLIPLQGMVGPPPSPLCRSSGGVVSTALSLEEDVKYSVF